MSIEQCVSTCTGIAI